MTILSKIIRKTSYFINKVLFKFIYKFFFFCIKVPPGDYCEREIPDPIPNSEVKPFCADGTLS